MEQLPNPSVQKLTLNDVDRLFELYKQHIDPNAVKPELYNNPKQWSDILKALKEH